MLLHVMHCKPMLCALLHEKLAKRTSSILSTLVQPQAFNLHIMLCVYPSHIFFVHFKHFILRSEDHYHCIVRVIIGECNVVPPPTQTGYGRRPPKICMYLHAHHICKWHLMLLSDLLAYSLHLPACITHGHGSFISQLYAFQSTAANHHMDYV
jgi:hypothetical protein